MTNTGTNTATQPDPFPAKRSNTARLLYRSTVAFAVIAVLCAGAMTVDPRTLRDVSVWAKPVKFCLSLAMYYLTLALLLPLVATSVRQTRWFRGAVFASIIAGAGEIAWIVIQAARGRASHFNTQTDFEAMMYSLMGVGAVILVTVTAIAGIAIALRPSVEHPRVFRAASSAGLIIGSILTLAIAGYMGGLSDHLTVPASSDAQGLALTGWSTITGDYRVPHFFATHAMQFLPFAGWLLARRNSTGLIPVLALSALYSAFVIALFVQAYAGHPLLPA